MKQEDETYCEEDTVARREVATKRMLAPQAATRITS